MRNYCGLKLTDDEIMLRFRSFIKLRVENKLTGLVLSKNVLLNRLEESALYKNSADKVVREIELIMLLKKYSA